MAKIIRTTIKSPRRRTGRKPSRVERITAAQEQDARRLTEWRRREARAARAQKQLTVRSDGVTRCSNCPPKHCCPDCARINNARQIAGLIRPKGDPRPHPNNCMPCIPRSQTYLGHKPDHPTVGSCSPIVSMEVKPLGGGWYLGQAILGLQVIYERKFRSRDAARRYAVNSMVDIKDGLKFERLLNG